MPQASSSRETVREARGERVERPEFGVRELRADVRSCHQGVDEMREGSGSPVGKTGGEEVIEPIGPPSLQPHQGLDHRQEPLLGCVPVVLAGDVAQQHGSRRRLRGKQRRDERGFVDADQRDDAALVREEGRHGLAPHVALGGR